MRHQNVFSEKIWSSRVRNTTLPFDMQALASQMTAPYAQTTLRAGILHSAVIMIAAASPAEGLVAR